MHLSQTSPLVYARNQHLAFPPAYPYTARNVSIIRLMIMRRKGGAGGRRLLSWDCNVFFITTTLPPQYSMASGPGGPPLVVEEYAVYP